MLKRIAPAALILGLVVGLALVRADDTPKYTVKQVMDMAHKDSKDKTVLSIYSKLLASTDADEQKKLGGQLVDLYTILGQNKPPRGRRRRLDEAGQRGHGDRRQGRGRRQGRQHRCLEEGQRLQGLPPGAWRLQAVTRWSQFLEAARADHISGRPVRFPRGSLTDARAAGKTNHRPVEEFSRAHRQAVRLGDRGAGRVGRLVQLPAPTTIRGWSSSPPCGGSSPARIRRWCQALAAGDANEVEKKRLLKVLTGMANAQPDHGSLDSWKAKTGAWSRRRRT